MHSIASGIIIYLHGTSSSGKTSIARALQDQERAPWIHLCLDYFCEMLAPKYQGNDWPLYEHLCKGLHRSAIVWAETGLNVIIDAVLEREELVRDACTVLAPHRAYFVGIFCALPVLEARESARPHHPQGLAKHQFELVHKHSRYDLEIQTDQSSPEESASAIARFVSNHDPFAFQHLRGQG